MIQLEQKTSSQIAKEISERIKHLRKQKHFTQSQMAERSGVSYASYKRFEQTGEISFDSLIRVAIALDCEKDFDFLFSKEVFSSIEEVIALQGRD